MVANRTRKKILLGLVLSVLVALASGAQSTSASEHSEQSAQDDNSSSTKHGHVRHTRIAEENGPPPELTAAEDLIQKQKYAEAAPLLQKVVAADPSNYVAWFDLGFTDNALGKIEESIAAYRKSVAAKPDVFESNLNLGLQLAKSNQPDAEQYLRAATQLKPTSHVAEGQERAWLSLAHVLEKSKPEEALAAYRQASNLQPKDPEPHVAAGRLLEEENKFADAEAEYKQAVALDASSDALIGLANVYMRGNNYPQAAEVLRKVVAQHPEDTAAHLQLGRVLAKENKNEDALAEIQTAAKADPSDADVQRELAELYTSSGKHDQAESIYRALLKTKPDDAELHDQLGRSLLHEKKFPEAQQEFLIALKLKPDFGDAYGDLAFAASENKNYPLTLKALDIRKKYLAENASIYFLRASAFDHLKDFKQAAANYHLFLSNANGKYPDQEWQAKHRLIAIEPKK